MRKLRRENGITLIALIITIIVMLILVLVTVSIALNGGLFETAKKAAEGTKTARDDELLMDAEGYIDAIQNRITAGSRATIGETEEYFYVIKDEGAKLVLLAEKNIKLNTATQKYEQSNGINPVPFDTTNYWSSVTDSSKYPLNLNEYGVYSEGSAIYIAKQYAEETIGNGAIGRLMTLEEVEALGGDSDNYTTEDCPDFINSTSYWLGSASNTGDVWSVYGDIISLSGDSYDLGNGTDYGVRPVIEISESSVTIVP